MLLLFLSIWIVSSILRCLFVVDLLLFVIRSRRVVEIQKDLGAFAAAFLLRIYDIGGGKVLHGKFPAKGGCRVVTHEWTVTSKDGGRPPIRQLVVQGLYLRGAAASNGTLVVAGDRGGTTSRLRRLRETPHER